jgi:hypothetical protein
MFKYSLLLSAHLDAARWALLFWPSTKWAEVPLLSTSPLSSAAFSQVCSPCLCWDSDEPAITNADGT